MNASKDENSIPTLIAVDSSDGVTIVPIKADPTTHRLMMSNGTTGDDLGPVNAAKDENGMSSIIAVSSVDGITPVVVYADSDGNLLVDNT